MLRTREVIRTALPGRRPLTAAVVIRRALLAFFTAIVLLVAAVFSACLLICYGPSESMRDMLVISAMQASATKWAPGLFMPRERVDAIYAASQQVTTDEVPAEDYAGQAQPGEWDNAVEGIRVDFLRENNFRAYMMLVRDPARVRVATASEDFSTAAAGATVFQVADRTGAIAAINGGEFADANGQGTGAAPMGLTYAGGRMVWNDGVSRTFMGFDKENRLICRDSMTRGEADRLGIRDAVCFQRGNVLIDQSEGKVRLHYADRNIGAAQRTAIGQRADGTVLLLVTDGRSAESIGATRNDVIDILSRYGAVSAGMLDGGSSSVLYYRDYPERLHIDRKELDAYQQQGLVNQYRAFTAPRQIPTFFVVTGEGE